MSYELGIMGVGNAHHLFRIPNSEFLILNNTFIKY